MKKVSIIIPNYNNERFIERCLVSVVRQDYPVKEIIVIDDGSTDASRKKIRRFIASHREEKIIFICQNNFNAAIARNKGLDVASGDYVVFLDSDDMLEENILSHMVDVCQRDKSDIVIGNYEEINENDECVGCKVFASNHKCVNIERDFGELIDVRPVPSNKLYNLNKIKKNNLYWDNVRIGQDLNFYLKYLALCKKATLINEIVYKYRISQNSMSRTYDFRIFDIVNVFSAVEKFYRDNGKELLYQQYLPPLALRHYGFQLEKQMFYCDLKTRKLIVKFFSVCENRLDYSRCRKNKDFKIAHAKFRLKCIFELVYTSKIYCKYRLKKRVRNAESD